MTLQTLCSIDLLSLCKRDLKALCKSIMNIDATRHIDLRSNCTAMIQFIEDYKLTLMPPLLAQLNQLEEVKPETSVTTPEITEVATVTEVEAPEDQPTDMVGSYRTEHPEMNQAFNKLLNAYPQLATQQGLIALLQEYGAKDKLCYPMLKDTQFWLELAGATPDQISIMKAFIDNPMSWRPMPDYPTFGHFITANNLTKSNLYDRVESVVHQFQKERGISSLTHDRQVFRGVEVNNVKPSWYLAPTELDKAYLKAEIHNLSKLFISLASGDSTSDLHNLSYDLVAIDWEAPDAGDCGLEIPTTPEEILATCQFAKYATIYQESYQWEEGFGRPCFKAEPDRIGIVLHLGFEEDSTCIEFKAVNPLIND